MEGFMYKFHPQWARVKELIDAGEIAVSTDRDIFGYMNENPDDIRDQKDAGGGALYDIGCYAVQSRVFSQNGNRSAWMCSQVIDPVFFTDAVYQRILDFDDVCATFTVSTKIYQHQRVDIHGEKGMITVDMPFNAHPDTSERLIIKADDEETIELCGPADQYQIQFESFAQRMTSCNPPLVPPSDAIANMHVIDMLFRSAENERWKKSEFSANDCVRKGFGDSDIRRGRALRLIPAYISSIYRATENSALNDNRRMTGD
jgi:predicted dehydrogenase